MSKWDREMSALADTFMKATVPDAPFCFRPGQTVVDSRLWRSRILSDIEDGPRGPRARTGALKDDLQNFMRVWGSRP